MAATLTQPNIVLTPQEVASEDCAFWANLMRIKLQRDVWEFKNHPFLVQPLQQSMLYRQGLAPEKQCVMKATQLGFSQTSILRSLHGLIYGHYKTGVLYLFPTEDDMRAFSKSRFGPLLNDNPTAIKRFVTDTNTESLKKVGSSGFLFMRGARLSQTVDAEAKDSAKLRSISVDHICYDEYDLMDPEVLTLAEGRLGDSPVEEQYFVSNPTLPGWGIASKFDESDQRYWFRRCLRCGATPPDGADWQWYNTKSNGWISAEVRFPNNVECGPDGKGFIACDNCGKPVGLDVGCWVPKEPHNSTTMWGYHLSQLSSATKDPYKILQQYTNPPNNDLDNVVRFKLGKPFISAEDKLTKQQVLGNCGVGLQLNSHHGPCAMGVDIRSHKNVVIGCRSGKNSYRILRVARIESMQDIMAMAYRFNVRLAVVDIRPYQDEMRQFQRDAKFKTYLCEYKENTPMGTTWDDNNGLVKINRTEIFDATHRMLVDNLIELPAVCPEVEQFAAECASVAKIPVFNKQTRGTTFRYRKLGDKPDDYRNALNYFIMAATSAHMPVVAGARASSNRPRFAKNDYNRFN